jgi:hypothetical protein
MLIQAPVRLTPVRLPDPNSEWIVAPEDKAAGDTVQLSFEHEEDTPLPDLSALEANYRPALINPSAELQQNCANILGWLDNRPADVDTRQALGGARAPRVDSLGVVANCHRGTDLMAQLMHCVSHTQAAYGGNLPSKVQNLLSQTLKAMQTAGIPKPYVEQDRIKPLAASVRSSGRPWS